MNCKETSGQLNAKGLKFGIVVSRFNDLFTGQLLKGAVDCLFNVPDAASRNRLELYGSLGSILAEGTIGQGEAGRMEALLEAAPGDYAAAQERTAAGGLAIAPPPVNMYRAEVERARNNPHIYDEGDEDDARPAGDDTVPAHVDS